MPIFIPEKVPVFVIFHHLLPYHLLHQNYGLPFFHPLVPIPPFCLHRSSGCGQIVNRRGLNKNISDGRCSIQSWLKQDNKSGRGKGFKESRRGCTNSKNYKEACNGKMFRACQRLADAPNKQ